MPLPENAVNPDEFLDYYQLLDQPADATTAEVRGRINDLYAEAQANRDHRNPQKRREYQLWLDLLPQARTVLTDEARRAKYDEYRRNVLAGAAVPVYAEFLRELEGKPAPSQEQASVLGLREEAAKPVETAPKPAPRPASSSSGGTSPTAGIAAIVALIVIAGIGAIAKQPAIGLVAGAVVAAVVFMALRGGNKVAR